MRSTGMSHGSRLTVLSAALLLMLCGAAPAQKQPKQPPPIQQGPYMVPTMDQPIMTTGPGLNPGAADPMRVRIEEERVKLLNDDRHKRLSSDVERLIALTNQLKSDVDRATKDELSIEVIKKAQEIEKLAHDVQSRMKN